MLEPKHGGIICQGYKSTRVSSSNRSKVYPTLSDTDVNKTFELYFEKL